MGKWIKLRRTKPEKSCVAPFVLYSPGIEEGFVGFYLCRLIIPLYVANEAHLLLRLLGELPIYCNWDSDTNTDVG